MRPPGTVHGFGHEEVKSGPSAVDNHRVKHDGRPSDRSALAWVVLLGARLGGLAGEVVERRRSLRSL